MTNKLLNNLYDGVELALHLQNEATENKIEIEKKNHLRYYRGQQVTTRIG